MTLKLLGEIAVDMKGSVTLHSFGNGVTTSMSQTGYNDEEIITMGRWKNDIFLRYVRLQENKGL